VEPARADDRYGDVEVDTNKAAQVYEKWLAMARPPRNSQQLRRPLWLNRPLRPTDEAFYIVRSDQPAATS
jgi:hypothetical protein